jgi:hypothetical protein
MNDPATYFSIDRDKANLAPKLILRNIANLYRLINLVARYTCCLIYLGVA